MNPSQMKTQVPTTGWSPDDSLKRTSNKLAAFQVGDKPIGPARSEASRRMHKHVTDDEILRFSGLSVERNFEVSHCTLCTNRMAAIWSQEVIPGSDEKHRITACAIPAVRVEDLHLTEGDRGTLRMWPEVTSIMKSHVTGCQICQAKVEKLLADRKDTARSFKEAITQFFFGKPQ
ncbi:MAG: hypothetical protein G01um101419_712 [Parcubacteria group bacterium Gr01-1014_19]|nr:MAG: hypothetical protein G01um101419_712 [Parcubacteria group bacterium Gr01-1014_19]